VDPEDRIVMESQCTLIRIRMFKKRSMFVAIV